MASPRDKHSALILVGGQGTRLRPLTYTVPKPIVPFANRPILHILIDTLLNAGVTRIVLATSSDLKDDKAVRKSVSSYLSMPNLEILFSAENVPLGTAGAIGYARSLLTFPCVVMNADITCEVKIDEMMSHHLFTKADATILATFVKDPSRYGVMEVEEWKVKKFWEKPQEYIGNRINAGVYIINESVMGLISGECSIEREVFPELAKNDKLSYFDLSGYWMDIGQAGDYVLGVMMYLKTIRGNKVGDSIYIDEKTVINANNKISLIDSIEKDSVTSIDLNESYRTFKRNKITFVSNNDSESTVHKSLIHPSAEIGYGSVIGPFTVIGANVVIGNYVRIEESTIMDGTTISHGAYIKHSVIGWNCKINKWARIEETSVLGEGVEVGEGVKIVSGTIGPLTKVVRGGNGCSMLNE